jgi:hypothetical protein
LRLSGVSHTAQSDSHASKRSLFTPPPFHTHQPPHRHVGPPGKHMCVRVHLSAAAASAVASHATTTGPSLVVSDPTNPPSAGRVRCSSDEEPWNCAGFRIVCLPRPSTIARWGPSAPALVRAAPETMLERAECRQCAQPRNALGHTVGRSKMWTFA